MFLPKSIVKKLLKNKKNKNVPVFNTVTYPVIMAKAELQRLNNHVQE